MKLPVVRVRRDPRDRLAEEIGSRAAEEARRRRPARGPLVRIVLLRLSNEEHVLVLAMHHIVGDGGSIDLSIASSPFFTRRFRTGGRRPFPIRRSSTRTSPTGRGLWLQGEEARRHLEDWRRQLLGAPPVLACRSIAGPPAPTYDGARVAFVVAAETVRRLKELARRGSATPFMVLLATFQALRRG